MRTEWIVVAVVTLIALYAVIVFNRLIRGRNLVREGFSGIDVQLKRRSDLVPNLVETVKAYAAHERGAVHRDCRKRTAAHERRRRCRQGRCRNRPAGFAAPAVRPRRSLSAAQSQSKFSRAANQIAELEDQLQMARRYYNGTVRDYNTSIQTFPDVLIAASSASTRSISSRSKRARRADAVDPAFRIGRIMRRAFCCLCFCCLRCWRPRAPRSASSASSVTCRCSATATFRLPRRSDIWAEGRQVKRGILRDFPTIYHRTDGSPRRGRLRSCWTSSVMAPSRTSPPSGWSMACACASAAPAAPLTRASTPT